MASVVGYTYAQIYGGAVEGSHLSSGTEETDYYLMFLVLPTTTSIPGTYNSGGNTATLLGSQTSTNVAIAAYGGSITGVGAFLDTLTTQLESGAIYAVTMAQVHGLTGTGYDAPTATFQGLTGPTPDGILQGDSNSLLVGLSAAGALGTWTFSGDWNVVFNATNQYGGFLGYVAPSDYAYSFSANPDPNNDPATALVLLEPNAISYPVPAITGISPTTGPGDTLVTVTGTGFTGATSVYFGSSSTSFTVISDTSLTALSSIGAPLGVQDITVHTPGGTSPVVSADRYTFTSGGYGAITIFSHPAFNIGGNYVLQGYNLYKSAAVSGGPNWFGPFEAVSAYTGYTQNTDIVDVTGTQYDLYQVEPIITATLPDGSTTTGVLARSRPFFSWQPLYDMSISNLLETMRNSWVLDPGVPQTESTSETETSGGNVMPFVSDPVSTRFYLSFLPNDNPVKLIADSCRVYMGTSRAAATPLVLWQDFAPSEDGGYIDFATVPPTNDYLRVEYTKVRITNDQLRSVLLNSVSSLSLYGINGYEVRTSNNLYYLVSPIANRDLGDVICEIGYRNLLNSQFLAQLEGAESWKDGKVEWSADPGRALQAAAGRTTDLEADIKRRANTYIVNTRNYIARGEFDSFFDVSGTLPVYTLIVAGANFAGAMGYWL